MEKWETDSTGAPISAQSRATRAAYYAGAAKRERMVRAQMASQGPEVAAAQLVRGRAVLALLDGAPAASYGALTASLRAEGDGPRLREPERYRRTDGALVERRFLSASGRSFLDVVVDEGQGVPAAGARMGNELAAALAAAFTPPPPRSETTTGLGVGLGPLGGAR
ncbi:hypothetical protein [Pseudonocardia sp. WMMC193]|uniref:hypothetical protein n=1 Tax=Pseudonocardia sp. WMMC193 TaxID=2911965 RepID=UPI001F344B13|nr:hypothetical protein [Pseudonocardia sp. WMMC193]MCF7550493.1 hypothetical protein [Pseudonocardia sp. WMMC193]